MMTKFISVIPLDNYILHITTDDGDVLDFDVLKELKRIPSYKRLYDIEFFKQVHFKNERIYWDYDHDFHIDQVLARAQKIA
jgi:hypothetical protein